MKNKGIKLSYGLFNYKWYRIDKHIQHLWIYIKRVRFVKKYSYPPFAKWETYYWFIKTMRPVLEHYRYNREGTPWVLGENYDPKNKIHDIKNETTYNQLLDRMIVLLDSMDENDKIYDNVEHKERYKMLEDAKNEFFRLFSEHFYDFWD